MGLYKTWLINIALAVFVVIITTKIHAVWTDTGREPADKPSVQAVKPGPAKKLIKRNFRSKSSFRAVVDKNLFSPDRAEYIPEVIEEKNQEEINEPEAEDLEAPKIKIVLHGVVITDALKTALIDNPEGKAGKQKNQWIKTGDKIGDLKVIALKQDRIILKQGATRYQVLLYNQKKNKSYTAAAKSSKPTVVSTKAAKVPAKAVAKTAKKIAGKSKQTISPDGKYIYTDTPFGRVKRRNK